MSGKQEQHLSADPVNLIGRVYEFHDGDGSGFGVGAPQFGARGGFYGGIRRVF